MISIGRPFEGVGYRDLLETLLPDFVLGFTFFTALSYAVLQQRFDHQRSAAAMSAALGLALALGQVWWQYDAGITLRQLGPIAIGMVVLVLAAVIYRAFNRIGGAWAGAGIALAVSLVVGTLAGLDLPIGGDVLALLAIGGIGAGVLAMMLHRSTDSAHSVLEHAGAGKAGISRASVEQDLAEIEQLRRRSHQLRDEFERLRKASHHLDHRPDLEGQVKTHLARTLPVQGWLTERLAALREKTHLMRRGELAQIHELTEHMRDLPKKQRRAAAREIKRHCKDVRLAQRIDRLDAAVAEAERRITQLSETAHRCLAEHDYPRLSKIFGDCTRLQQQISKLVSLIERDEQKLLREARKAIGGGESA